MRRQAFTLAELTVVLTIIAVVAAAVTLRIQGPLGRARQRDVVESIGAFDHTTRVAAREQDRPLRLVIDAEAGELRRADGDGRLLESGRLRLPDGFRFERLLLRGADADAGFAGVSMVPCSRHGLTPSYALLLDCGGVRRWLLVAGLTGTVVEVADEDEARQTLAVTGLRGDAR